MPRTAPERLFNDLATRIRDAVEAIEPGLIAIRRDIHAHPELGFEEVRTSGIVAAELARLGIAHRTGIGRTGVVGTIEGARPGPTLAIRADMDALPIQEETGLPFASTVPGKMHACGHDIHTTTLLGVAEVLRDLAPQLAGRVLLVFQPAEEALGGAAAMVEDGVLEGVDMALGFHNAPDMPVGRFGYCRGATLAAADRFELVVQGKSGHAAHPEKAVDPIVAAGNFIAQAQTVVSREIDPLMPAVVTIGMIHGGSAPNIIPETVELRGTVRTLHRESRDIAEGALKRLAAGLDAMHRTRSTLAYRRGVPPLTNADSVLDPAVAAVRRQLGEVVEEGKPSMGAEDFAEFAERVPAFQLRIGSGAPGRRDALHNDRYQPDERCIGLGVQALSRIALDMLA
ncbi:M20 metallopeptidase family protein [Paracraurococcus lichenis]|uniref:M20 family metallopeptidase n=1 Tax=Paracraurococcus lichenis TaxID=3064888 RepID=A0ABT9E0A1_9PROT|nr:M20 family metallopeptidase [Paracraurococcus sp. LOR1-02]MDO9709592.1 M20 family metallopeptidase [Paracraurococcus sp. LOR1-02]